MVRKKLEGVNLSKEDLEKFIEILDNLYPKSGYGIRDNGIDFVSERRLVPFDAVDYKWKAGFLMRKTVAEIHANLMEGVYDLSIMLDMAPDEYNRFLDKAKEQVPEVYASLELKSSSYINESHPTSTKNW